MASVNESGYDFSEEGKLLQRSTSLRKLFWQWHGYSVSHTIQSKERQNVTSVIRGQQQQYWKENIIVLS